MHMQQTKRDWVNRHGPEASSSTQRNMTAQLTVTETLGLSLLPSAVPGASIGKPPASIIAT